jgi:hypothetical protein
MPHDHTQISLLSTEQPTSKLKKLTKFEPVPTQTHLHALFKMRHHLGTTLGYFDHVHTPSH